MAAYMLVVQEGVYYCRLVVMMFLARSLRVKGIVFVTGTCRDYSVERAMNAANALAGMLDRETEESREDA